MHPAPRRLALLSLVGCALSACGDAAAPPPVGLSYSTPAALYTVGLAAPANRPTVTNAVTAWRVEPALPAGLTLDATTGVIGGTPTIEQPGIDYLVTASNASGAATASLNITIRPAGHLSAKRVHFFDSAGWGAVNLLARTDDGGWPAAPGVAMASEGAGWFSSTLAASRTSQFSFNDGMSSLPADPVNAFRNSWEEVWVKDGLLFTSAPGGATAPAGLLTLLTLNLHTYQEVGFGGGTQAEKLDRVADAIAALGADFVMLQECAQDSRAAIITDPRAHLVPGSAEVLKSDNMAYLISRRLQEVHGLTYEYAWSWAHYGFTFYEEGVAILTRHPIDSLDAAYVSTSTSLGDPLGARKAIHVGSTLPGGQVVNLFSAHLGFSGPEQDRQLDALRAWMAGKRAGNGAVASIVGGDFNMDAGLAGYLRMTSVTGGERYVDAAWRANPEGCFDPTILDGRRIDYLFFAAGDALEPLTAQRYFLPGDAWLGERVSDHFATIVRLRLTP
jgi:endonuclease/exonuclease/phosphatase family metal-dependent hydrolase